jgi:ribonuclease G
MVKEILVDADSDLTRVAVLEDGNLAEIYVERNFNQRVAGNIYKGKVVNVLPGMQAAFVNIGLEKNAFLYVDDVITDEDPSGDNEVYESVKPPSINDVLKVGQDVLVQVVKEPMGTKGARVTNHITLPGRYLVLMPMVDYIGVSRRIESEQERARLKKLAEEVRTNNMGLIVRTAAEGVTREELAQDIKFLTKLWGNIQSSKKGLAPQLVHKDYSLLYRIVRDMLSIDVDKMHINNRQEYFKVMELLELIAPNMKSRVVTYNNQAEAIFDHFNIEEEIEKALNRKVWLKSGGYLVIDHTEALTSIDVNTGKFVGAINLEDTVLKTNIEAAGEIARQLRLRDIGGIIIIDFIDMDTPEHQKQVISMLEEELKKDRTKANVLGLTQLGLVEMTRKKVRQGLDEVLLKVCPYCEGKGRIVSEETMGKKVEHELYKLFNNKKVEAVLVEVHPTVASVVIGPGGVHLNKLEEKFERNIYIRGNADIHPGEIAVKAVGSKEKAEVLALPVREGQIIESVVEAPHASNPRNGIIRVDGYVIDVEDAGRLAGETAKVQVTKVYRTYARGRLV